MRFVVAVMQKKTLKYSVRQPWAATTANDFLGYIFAPAAANMKAPADRRCVGFRRVVCTQYKSL